MARWDAAASTQLQQLKQSTNASNPQIDDLRTRINAWADQNADGRRSFPFTALKMRDAAVGVRTKGGWIVDVQWGDRMG